MNLVWTRKTFKVTWIPKLNLDTSKSQANQCNWKRIRRKRMSWNVWEETYSMERVYLLVCFQYFFQFRSYKINDVSIGFFPFTELNPVQMWNRIHHTLKLEYVFTRKLLYSINMIYIHCTVDILVVDTQTNICVYLQKYYSTVSVFISTQAWPLLNYVTSCHTALTLNKLSCKCEWEIR